jgi:hypothetical protein
VAGLIGALSFVAFRNFSRSRVTLAGVAWSVVH